MGFTSEPRTKNGAEQVRYVPRSPEEMAKIETIVKSAVNFDPERGDKVEVGQPGL